MSPRLLVACAVVLCGSAARADDAPVPIHPAARVAQKRAEYQQIVDGRVASLYAARPKPISDVLRVNRVAGGSIEVDVAVAPPRVARADVPVEDEGEIRAFVQPMTDAEGALIVQLAPQAGYVGLEWWRLARADVGVEHLQLSSFPGQRLNLSYDLELGDGSLSVQLIDSPYDDDGRVKLVVQRLYETGDRPPHEVRAQADSLDALLGSPADGPAARAWLAPAFVLLRAPLLLVPGGEAGARQALLPTAEPDPAADARVKTWLAALDGADAAARAVAEAELSAAARGDLAVAAALNRARAAGALSPDAELAVDAALADSAPLAPDAAAALAGDPEQLRVVLLADDAALRRLASKQIERLTGKPPTLDADAPRDARVEAYLRAVEPGAVRE